MDARGDGEHAVYVLRHGRTEWSHSGRHTGSTDLELAPEGETQAVAAGALLRRLRGDAPPALVLTSPRVRARRTAELAGLVGPRVGAVEVSPDLQEWDYGEYEGRTTPQIRESVPGWTVWTHPSPGGETAEQVGVRADAVLARCAAALADGDVVLVCHGHIGRVLAARWIGLPATGGVRLAFGTGAVTVLGSERGVPQLERVNVAPDQG